MRKLRVSIRRISANPSILEKYEVDAHAYGFCPKCSTIHDYWKYGETAFRCPGCRGPLRELKEEELAEALADCEQEGCFEELFAYSTPSIPKRREERT